MRHTDTEAKSLISVAAKLHGWIRVQLFTVFKFFFSETIIERNGVSKEGNGRHLETHVVVATIFEKK